MTAVLPVRHPPQHLGDRDSDRDKTELSGADAEASERFWKAIVVARELLSGTVNLVDPGTSAEKLLQLTKDYRACVAELVAVLPVPDGGHDV